MPGLPVQPAMSLTCDSLPLHCMAPAAAWHGASGCLAVDGTVTLALVPTMAPLSFPCHGPPPPPPPEEGIDIEEGIIPARAPPAQV